MKTIDLEEIKNKVAKRYSYKSWYALVCNFREKNISYLIFKEFENEAMQEYAKQCCNEQKIACAANAITMDDPKDYGKYEIGQVVDRESILSTPNVAEKP